MAAADYYLCDLCERKTFYDAELHYGDYNNPVTNENPITHHPWPVGVGSMIVLCAMCAKYNDITVTEKGGTV